MAGAQLAQLLALVRRLRKAPGNTVQKNTPGPGRLALALVSGLPFNMLARADYIRIPLRTLRACRCSLGQRLS